MTVICSFFVGDEKNFATLLEKLEGHNLPCELCDGVMKIQVTGPKKKVLEFVDSFKSLAECEITVLSQRAWKDDKK